MKSVLLLLLVADVLARCSAYSVSPPSSSLPSVGSDCHTNTDTRRHALAKLSLGLATLLSAPLVSRADIDVSAIEMKEFVDPYGLFSINVPNGFYTLRRKAKGDLPDEKTGKGRRGSSIFTAGNMAKAEVIAVER